MRRAAQETARERRTGGGFVRKGIRCLTMSNFGATGSTDHATSFLGFPGRGDFIWKQSKDHLCLYGHPDNRNIHHSLDLETLHQV